MRLKYHKVLSYLFKLAKGSLRSPFSRHSEGFGKCMGTLGGHKGSFVLLTPDGHKTDTRTEGHRTDTGQTYGDPRGVIGGLLYEAESIFNVIFEIYAVFTCYLTYYKPSAKKSW